MKVIELTYSVGKTIQIKPYEPINLHASIKAEVSPKEDLQKAFNDLKEIVGQQIKKDIELLQAKKTEAISREEYPFGQCATCEAPMRKSEKGNLICSEQFTNPKHKAKTELDPNQEQFLTNLK
jgi:hypothetical protein